MAQDNNQLEAWLAQLPQAANDDFLDQATGRSQPRPPQGQTRPPPP